MTLEQNIKDTIAKKMEDGSVEKIIGDQIEKAVTKAMEELVGWRGDVSKVIEEKLKDVMVPYLQNYDFNKYVTTLDSVLVAILKEAPLDHSEMLKNFQGFMTVVPPKTITTTELFDKWQKYVEEHVSTDDLEVEFDDGPSYETVEINMEFEEENDRSWSSFEGGVLDFICEKDEEMNFSLPLSRWKKDKNEKHWDIQYRSFTDLTSLRRLNEFEMFLIQLTQNYSKLVMEEKYINEFAQPKAEPEATFE